MINWKKLQLVKESEICELSDISSPMVESLLFRMAKGQLTNIFLHNETKDAISITESDGYPITFSTLEEFTPDKLCDYFTYELLCCENHAYCLLEMQEKDNPEQTFYVITLNTGNPMGAVYQQGKEESIFEVYDGGLIEVQVKKDQPFLRIALDLLYCAGRLDITVEEYLTMDDPDCQYYKKLFQELEAS